MFNTITVWLTGMVCVCLVAGCVSGRADRGETDAKRFARGAEGADNGQMTAENPQAKSFLSVGSGRPDRREVPALITPLKLPEQPTPPAAIKEISPSGNTTKVYALKRNDGVIVYLRGIPKEEQIEVIVDENGFITLPFLDGVRADGKTASELEQTIRDAYVQGKIYKSVTVNVMIPTQSYFIRGEVRGPSRYPLVPGTTILQAVATAGGYTEFANAKKIKVLRGDNFFFVDAKDLEMHPELDKEIEAGDVIVVPRSVF